MLEYRETERGRILSAGYPAVEDLIDSENFEAINNTFERAYQQLEVIAKQRKGGLKRGREARQAMKSIELVMDLLSELLAIKYRLQGLAKVQKKSP